MNIRNLLALVLPLSLLSPLSVGQWLDLPTPGIPRTATGEPDLAAAPPRTAWGAPDLSGVWIATTVEGDLPESGKFMEWVVRAMADHEANFYGDQPRYNCLPSGPSYLTAGSTSTGYRRIVQSPEVIAILHEDMNYRTIFLDGRELETEPLPTWMGYSVGRWEGDTLVVESNGYNDRTWLDRRGIMHTEQLRVTERYQRPDFGSMTLNVRYEDPGAFTEPVEATIRMKFQADTEMLEYVCNETAQLGSNWTGSIHEAAATALEVDPGILEGYVGTFEGPWLGNLITLVFRVEDGRLKLLRNGVDVQLIPQSEKAFDGSNGFAFVFHTDESGLATHVEEIHVSGGWMFPRTE